MSYIGLFYLRELDTVDGKKKDVFLKPEFVRISVAPEPSKIVMVSYALSYWVGYQPKEEDWSLRKRYVSPFRNIVDFGYSSRLKLDSEIEDVCEEIRRHFIDLVLSGKNAYSEKDAFSLLSEKNTSEYTFCKDDKTISVKNVYVTKEYVSESSEYFSTPTQTMFLSEVSLENSLTTSIHCDKKIDISDIRNKKMLMEAVRSFYG